MAVIQSVQSGSETIVAGDGTSIAITLGSSVTLAQSFLVCTWRDADTATRERRHTFTEELSSTTITLTRNDSSFASSVTCEWYVYEFDSSVTVQRGIFAPATISESETITAVNTGSTFVTASFSANADAYNRFTADLTSTTNIDFDSAGSVLVGNIAYQVVEFDSGDASVQKFTGTIATSSTDATLSLTTIDTAKTFVGSEFGYSESTFAPSVRHRDKCVIDSTTQATYSRTSNHTSNIYHYSAYIVEMLDGSTVQSGTATIADTGTSTTATITALTNGGMIQGSTNGNEMLSSSTGAQPDDLRATQAVSGTTVTFARGGSSEPLEIEWFAVEWNAAAGGGLVVQDLSVLTSLTSPSLTQHNALAVDNLAVSMTLTEPVLSQHNTLVTQNLAVATSLTEPALTQNFVLSTNDLAVGTSLTSPALTQHHALVVDNLAVGTTLSNVTLSIAGVIAVQDLSVGTTISSPALDQHNILVVDDLAVSSTISEPALIQHNALAVDNLVVGTTITNAILNTGISLLVQNLAVGTVVSVPTLTQHNALIVDDLTVETLLSNVTLSGAAIGCLNGRVVLAQLLDGKVTITPLLGGNITIH